MDNDNTNKTNDLIRTSLMNIAIESWRFSRLFERVVGKLDIAEQKRYISQYRWFIKKLDESLIEADMRIENVEGCIYDPGIAATAINLDEFEKNDQLIVDQMLEPIIMGKEGLVKSGTITLRRADI